MLLPEQVNLTTTGRTCARYTAAGFFDGLARLSTHGRLSAAELVKSLAEPELNGSAFDARFLAWFGYVAAARVGTDITVGEVADILGIAARLRGGTDLTPRMCVLRSEAQLLSGRVDTAPLRQQSDPALDERRWAVATDLLNPFLSTAPGDIERWLAELSRPFTDAGLASLSLLDDDGMPFDRVTAEAIPAGGSDELPLVSVIVPVYSPGPSLVTALRSLVQQTWPALEIVLCDDGSPEADRGLIDACVAMDPRITVVRANENRGAYAARNLGLRHATGTFITFQDADDWSHPQRIELQVRELLRNDALMATVSRSLRVSDRLTLTMLGRRPGRVNLSAVTFRRIPVLSRLGGFDSVRRGADTEFVHRLAAAFGSRSIGDLGLYLALVQRTTGSLSRDDLMFLRRHPARDQYRVAFSEWHARIAAGEESPLVVPPVRAPFPAPAHIEGKTRSEPVDLDVVVMANVNDNAPTSPDIAAELRAVSGTGLRVGVREFVGPYDLTRPVGLPDREIAAMARAGLLDWLLPGEMSSARLAVIRDPAAVVAMGDEVIADVEAERFLLIADYEPGDEGGYDPAAVEDALRRRARGGVSWLPATPAIANALAAGVRSAHVREPRLWACVPPPGRERVEGPRAVVGTLPPPRTWSRPQLRTWARTALPADPGTRVWAWGSGKRLAAAINRPVTDIDPARVPLDAFLRQVAYVVTPPAPGRGAHLDRFVVRSLVHGCVPIVPASYADHLGDAAISTGHLGADDWIQLHRQRPELYREQQRRGYAALAERLSAESLRRTLTAVLDDPSEHAQDDLTCDVSDRNPGSAATS